MTEINNKMTSFIKSKYVYFVTMIISSVVLLSCLIINRCIPYGDNFPIAGLGLTQHYCWFVDCINQIKEGVGLSILDYSEGLVKDNYDTGAYAYIYMLLRPWLYIIYLIVPEELYVVVFAMGYYLYFLLSGPIFIYFISHRRVSSAPHLSDAKLILLGLMYTMSTYSTAYFIYQGFRYMVFIPIIFLGLEKLIYDNKPVLYVCMLFYMMATDAYCAFILCIFLVMFFCTLEYDSFGSFVKKALRFAVYSFFAAGMAAFSLIPFFIRTRYSPYESGDNSVPSILNWFGNLLFSISDYSPVREGIITTPEEYRANIYCGLIAFLVLPLYWGIKTIKKSTKIGVGLFLIITFLAFDNKLLNYVFHGFHHQWQVPNRYASFFIFMLLCVFADVIGNLEDISDKKALISVVSMSIFLGIAYLFVGYNSNEEDSTIISFIPGFIFLGIYIALALINSLVKQRKKVLVFIYTITCIELVASCFVSLRFSTNTEGTDETLGYTQEMKSFSVLCNDMSDPFVITERPGTNDNQNIACLTNTNSLSYYTSSSYKQSNDLMNRWGMLFSTNLTYYTTGEPLTDMMLHVRYHVTDKEDIYTNSPYEVVAQSSNLLLHYNKYALPLGILIENNKNLEEWNSKSSDSYDTPFDRENAFAHCFGVDNIYDDISISRIDTVEDAVDSSECYYVVNEDETGGATYVFLIGENVSGALYMQVSNTIEYIGTACDGNCDTLYFYAPRTLYNVINAEPSFGIWNEQCFSELYKKLAGCVMTDQKYGRDYIKGKIHTDKSGLLYLAIPCFPGFTAYVDGKECSINNYLDGIALDISEGDHMIELNYTPKGLWAGIIVSIFAFIGLFGYLVCRCLKNIDKNKKEKLYNYIRIFYLLIALLPFTICLHRTTYAAFSNAWFIILMGLIVTIICKDNNDDIELDDNLLHYIKLMSLLLSGLFLIMLPLGDVIINDSFIAGNPVFQIWKWIIYIPALIYSTLLSTKFILERFVYKAVNNTDAIGVQGKRNISSNKCIILIIIESLVFLLSTYPGYFLQDDVLRVLLRVYENSPSDWDTYGYYLFVKIFTLNGSFIYGVNIIQTLLWIFVNVYIIRSFEKWSVKAMRVYTIITLISVGPMLYLEILYKDTVFSMGMLALVAGMFNVIRNKSVNKADIFILTIPTFFATLCRKGGAVAPLFGCIILSIYLYKNEKKQTKKSVAVFASHILIYILIYTVLFNLNNVKNVDPYVKYGTPLSMIGAAAKENVEFEEEDVKQLEQVMELSEWSRCYNRFWVDSIARLWGDIETENLVKLNDLVKDDDYGSFILELNAKILFKHPGIWLDSFFAMANQLWEISTPYDMPIYNAKDTQLFYFEQDESITYTPLFYLTDMVTNVYNDVTILHTVFYRGGLSVFIMIFSIIVLYISKKRKYILVFLPLIAYCLVLSLAIPASDMRYILPILETTAFVVAFISDVGKLDDGVTNTV